MKRNQKRAVALGYESEQQSAPRVLAKGRGYVAENILNKASEEGIPIQEDASLIELLAELNINEQIPEELYHVVAELFAFIYRSDQEFKN
ncbi:EscU/YscU/HrcU family type III secretion system export apparatus switch protein [Halobacillus sp. A5]|uniref:EscU/YscU/HrcU family type III secretion system export apparatus switch protein n=1 Tax=Halobacillus sp. A5 TaxID=2880263 RepID=UPI0020A64FC7|nr:EscU/YscU/HrcU family type III secretion system export apparatus switch protein [Halobacillus sp. A5]MCP3026137.1 EscU/YscU/HrcU family type III secretion system export apparatus switch protein [Halobacillus sp. A5]